MITRKPGVLPAQESCYTLEVQSHRMMHEQSVYILASCKQKSGLTDFAQSGQCTLTGYAQTQTGHIHRQDADFAHTFAV